MRDQTESEHRLFATIDHLRRFVRQREEEHSQFVLYEELCCLDNAYNLDWFCVVRYH